MGTKYGALQEDLDEMDAEMAQEQRQGSQEKRASEDEHRPEWLGGCTCSNCLCKRRADAVAEFRRTR